MSGYMFFFLGLPMLAEIQLPLWWWSHPAIYHVQLMYIYLHLSTVLVALSLQLLDDFPFLLLFLSLLLANIARY